MSVKGLSKPKVSFAVFCSTCCRFLTSQHVLCHPNCNVCWFKPFRAWQRESLWITLPKTVSPVAGKQKVPPWESPSEGQVIKAQHLPKVPKFSSVAQSCPTLRPHELQRTRPPCPSPTPGVHPNPCPLSRWCHPIISSSVIPFSSCCQSFPVSGSFMS